MLLFAHILIFTYYLCTLGIIYIFYSLYIQVDDLDGDEVRCRWARSSDGECAGVCNAFPDAILDQVMYILLSRNSVLVNK